jgi:PKD repeat protein
MIMKKITFIFLTNLFLFQSVSYGQLSQINDTVNGDWTEQQVTLYNTTEADIMVRSGDIDNLGFGWPAEFDPFSGNSTPSHGYPWTADTTDWSGTDRIMVISSYNGTPPYGQDGYTSYTSRPENLPRPILLSFELDGLIPESAALQIFTDDFQSPRFHSHYFVTLNGISAPYIAEVINTLNQTGPIGKIINITIPEEHLYLIESDSLSIFFDDTITGAGDGYAIDFVKLLINPKGYTYTAKVYGYVTDNYDGYPIENSIITAIGTKETLTNSDGFYLLEDIPAGLSYLSATKFSYDTATILIELKDGDSLKHNFKLNEILDAEFVADAPEGYSLPHTVNFTDLTSLDPTDWNWDFGDGGTSTERNPTHVYNNSGSYTVSLTASNATETNTETKSEYINIMMEGIGELRTISGLIISPNPASGMTTISFVLSEPKDVHLKLFDLTGKLAFSKLFQNQAQGEFEISFGTNHLKDGIYLLQLQAGESYLTQKLEIMH